jgi:PAS domain S-box-containing protein
LLLALAAAELRPDWGSVTFVLALGAIAVGTGPALRRVQALTGFPRVMAAIESCAVAVSLSLAGHNARWPVPVLLLPLAILHPAKTRPLSPWITGAGIALLAVVAIADGAAPGIVAAVVAAATAAQCTARSARDAVDEARLELETSVRLLEETRRLARIGHWEWSARERTLVWSDELFRICGYSPGSVLPSMDLLLSLVHPEDRAAVAADFEAAFGGAGPSTAEYRLVTPSGEVRWIHARRESTRTATGELRALGTAQDISERKDLESKLVLSDRLASLGTLAGGVAHEINNPLGYVTANLDYVRGELERTDAVSSARVAELKRAVGEARHGAERVRRIVRDLKTFARGDDETTGPVDVRRVLELCVNMAASELKLRARLVKDYRAVPAVIASETRLGQVIVNLLVNAAQAIPEGAVDDNEIRLSTGVEAGQVIIEVRDTGSGIPREHLDKIFNPFFTTKPIGAGTGLGLSICHGIVRSFGGNITVDSEVGRGTCFRVALPRSNEPIPESAAWSLAPQAQATTTRGRVLIVDDEPLLAASLRRLLAREYDVEVSDSGQRALERLSAHEFDVVICDLMMPDITGYELHERLTRSDPRTAARLIFITGGAFTTAAKEFVDRMPDRCLAKPVNIHSLRAIMQQLAD